MIKVSSNISFKDTSNDEIGSYTIVGHEEVDPIHGTISNNSPIAQQLLDAKINQKIEVNTPKKDLIFYETLFLLSNNFF